MSPPDYLGDRERAGVAALIVAAPWLDELAAIVLLEGTDEERTLIVQARATAAVTEGPEAWQTLLSVLGTIAGAASAVSSLTGAVQAVYGLRSL